MDTNPCNMRVSLGPSNVTCSGSRGLDTTKFPESGSLVTLAFPFRRGMYLGSLEIGSIPSTSTSSYLGTPPPLNPLLFLVGFPFSPSVVPSDSSLVTFALTPTYSIFLLWFNDFISWGAASLL